MKVPMQIKPITFTMHPQAAGAILNILGDLPNKSGVYPLLVDLTNQFKAQTTEDSGPTAQPPSEAPTSE
jgi:hypothetical protein